MASRNPTVTLKLAHGQDATQQKAPPMNNTRPAEVTVAIARPKEVARILDQMAEFGTVFVEHEAHADWADTVLDYITQLEARPTRSMDEGNGLLNKSEAVEHLKNHIRDHHNGRQNQFAESVGLSCTYISEMLRGYRNVPSDVWRTVGLKKVESYKKVSGNE